MSMLRDEALRYLAHGYVPLWVPYESKAAKTPGWQSIHPDQESIVRMFARPSNLGIRTGDIHPDGTCLAGIDIDLEEHQLIRAVDHAIGEKVPVKQGKKGYTYIVRLSEQVPSKKIPWHRNGNKTAAIDLLCRGAQTVIPPSIHPETKQPYRWVAGVPLSETPYHYLPIVPVTALDEIKGFCANPDDPIQRLNDMEWRGVGGGGDTHETCLVAVFDMVRRQWPDEDIHARITRAKNAACERAGMPFDWPQSQKVIQEWIDSSKVKLGSPQKTRKVSHGAFADAFLEQAGHHIRFDRDQGCWYFFDGCRWQAQQDFRVRNSVDLFLPTEVRNSQVVGGVERSLRDRPVLSIWQSEWDPDAHLLNTPAGTVDLRMGTIRPSRAEDLITRCTAVAPANAYEGSLFSEKLIEWFGDDPEELRYIQTLAGYFLTGETRHACLPLWIGPGGDGKSVIANVFRYIMKDYARTSTDTAFVETRYGQHAEEIAWLNGARLVLVNEINGSAPWNEARIKAVTGGENLSASFKGKHNFEFCPRFKLLITGNEAPFLRSVGPEFRRRFHVLKFTRGVEKPDPELPEKLRAEAGAILAWMIEGAARYYLEGLRPSPLVAAATAEYFEDNDLIQQWINERCDVGPEYRIEGSVAYEDICEWRKEQGFDRAMTRPRFTAKLKAKGFEAKTGTLPGKSNSVRCYFGLRLKLDDCRF